MTTWFDTGILLKLYTTEPESVAVQSWVRNRTEPIRICVLHRSECSSALHLKAFRGECDVAVAARALDLVESDLRSGVLRMVAVDWDAAWETCHRFATRYAAETGVRTLDTLHVACALQLEASEFVTSDRRQATLADQTGLTVIDPTTGTV